MQNIDKVQATAQLVKELEKGKRSGEQEGWLTPEEVKEHFSAKANKE